MCLSITIFTQRHHTQSNMTRARDEVYCKLTSNLLENVNRDVFRGACTMTSDSSYIRLRSTFRAAHCTLIEDDLFTKIINRDNIVGLILFTSTLYSLLTNSVRCVMCAQACAIDRISRYFVHSFVYRGIGSSTLFCSYIIYTLAVNV